MRWFSWIGYIPLLPMILGRATWWVVGLVVSVFFIGFGLGGLL